MFVYENGNSLNLTFKGSIPVENPEVVIKGYKDGATLTVNGTTYGTGSEKFEGKAKTFVFQKDGKLMITFNGIQGIDNPEVTLDEPVKGTVNAVVCGTSVTLNYTDDGVTVAGEANTVVEEVVEDTPVEEEEATDPVEDEEPEEVEAE